MPDLDPLPPLGPVAGPPPRRDFADVLGRAMHRRRALRTRAVGGVAAVAALALSVSAGVGGTPAAHRIDVDPADRPSAAAASPSATGAAALPGAPGRTTGPAASAEPRSEPEPEPEPTDVPAPASTPSSATPRPSERPDPPITRTFVDDRPGEPCRTVAEWSPESEAVVAQDRGWCVRYIDPTTVDATGSGLTLGIEVCRLATGRDANVVYLTQTADVGFLVSSDDDEWQGWWAHFDAADAAERTLTIESGKCVRWTISWDLADRYGVPLPRGRYHVTVVVLGWSPRTPPPAGQGDQSTRHVHAGRFDLTIG